MSFGELMLSFDDGCYGLGVRWSGLGWSSIGWNVLCGPFVGCVITGDEVWGRGRGLGIVHSWK